MLPRKRQRLADGPDPPASSPLSPSATSTPSDMMQRFLRPLHRSWMDLDPSPTKSTTSHSPTKSTAGPSPTKSAKSLPSTTRPPKHLPSITKTANHLPLPTNEPPVTRDQNASAMSVPSSDASPSIPNAGALRVAPAAAAAAQSPNAALPMSTSSVPGLQPIQTPVSTSHSIASAKKPTSSVDSLLPSPAPSNAGSASPPANLSMPESAVPAEAPPSQPWEVPSTESLPTNAVSAPHQSPGNVSAANDTTNKSTADGTDDSRPAPTSQAEPLPSASSEDQRLRQLAAQFGGIEGLERQLKAAAPPTTSHTSLSDTIAISNSNNNAGASDQTASQSPGQHHSLVSVPTFWPNHSSQIPVNASQPRSNTPRAPAAQENTPGNDLASQHAATTPGPSSVTTSTANALSVQATARPGRKKSHQYQRNQGQPSQTYRHASTTSARASDTASSAAHAFQYAMQVCSATMITNEPSIEALQASTSRFCHQASLFINASDLADGPKLISSARLGLLYQAAKKKDIVYLALHQIYCLHARADVDPWLLTPLSFAEISGLRTMDTLLGPNSAIPPQLLQSFTSVSGQLTSLFDKSTLWRAAVNQARQVLAQLGTGGGAFLHQCQRSEVLPTNWDIENNISVASPTVRVTIFRYLFRPRCRIFGDACTEVADTLFERDSAIFERWCSSPQSFDVRPFRLYKAWVSDQFSRLIELHHYQTHRGINSHQVPPQPWAKLPEANAFPSIEAIFVAYLNSGSLVLPFSPRNASDQRLAAGNQLVPRNHALPSLPLAQTQVPAETRPQNSKRTTRPSADQIRTSMSHTTSPGTSAILRPTNSPLSPMGDGRLRSSDTSAGGPRSVATSEADVEHFVNTVINGTMPHRKSTDPPWPLFPPPNGKLTPMLHPPPGRAFGQILSRDAAVQQNGQTWHDKFNLYSTLASFLLPPVSLLGGACNAHGNFTITPELNQLIARETPGTSGAPPTRMVHIGSCLVRVRCIKSGSDPPSEAEWAVSEPAWPDSIVCRLNNTHLDIRRKMQHGKDRPIDITGMVKPGVNELQVSILPKLAPNEAKEQSQFALAVEVLKLVDTATMTRLVGELPRATVEASIARQLQSTPAERNDEELQVLTSAIQVCVLDPFSARLPDQPVRTVDCPHLECFDLDVFLATRVPDPQRPTQFKCPICGRDARPSRLRHDRWMDSVLRAIRDSKFAGSARSDSEAFVSDGIAQGADSRVEKAAANADGTTAASRANSVDVAAGTTPDLAPAVPSAPVMTPAQSVSIAPDEVRMIRVVANGSWIVWQSESSGETGDGQDRGQLSGPSAAKRRRLEPKCEPSTSASPPLRSEGVRRLATEVIELD